MDGSGSKLSIHCICRVCLKQLKNDDAYDLFNIPGLVKKFCICTSLSVEPQDGYPKNICGVCHTRLNELHDFQKQCVDSVQRFQEMVAANTFSVELMESIDDPNAAHDYDEQPHFDPLLDQKLELVENQEDVFKMLEAESMVEKQEEEETNPFDEKNFYSNDSSSESEKYISDDDYGAAAADGDSATSESDDEMPLSLRVGSKSKIKQDPSSDGEEDKKNAAPKRVKAKRRQFVPAERPLDRIIECHICQKKFKSHNNYQDHMKCHNDKLTHTCTVETCLKGFTTENALRVHTEHCHPDTLQSIPCPEEGCESRFPRTRQLRYHLKTVHKMDKEVLKQRSFPCTECDKVFCVPIALKKHMYKHNGEELPFPCNICGKRFVINSELKFHLMRHAGIKNFVCPICGAGKTTRQELNQHMNTHLQEKKYKCDYCDHASTNKQAMSNHMKVIHENIKEFACQYCGKTFGKANACKMHELRHTGDMPYKCSICNKGFIYAKVLTVHLKTHEKWKRAPKPEVPADKKRKRRKPEDTGDGTTVKERKPPRNKVPKIPRPLKTPAKRKETDVQLLPPLPAMYTAEPVVVRQNPRHVERVDISQLAGTIINPIPLVQLASWPPQDSSCMTNEFVLPQDNTAEALEFPFTCPDCGQGFNFSGNLKTHHRIVHEKIRDYACRYCENRFGKAMTLKYHEMRHTGEKPEICMLCDFRCIKPDQLKRHQKVHMRPERPIKSGNTKRTPRQNTTNRPRSPSSPIDPAVALAAREELEEHERKELDAKREAEEKRQAIADAAKEQLIIMQQQQAELESSQY